MANDINYAVEDILRDGERDTCDNSGRQFASGGAPGMEMAVSPTAQQTMPAELPGGSPDQQDFLMIQLSSFEGRANH